MYKYTSGENIKSSFIRESHEIPEHNEKKLFSPEHYDRLMNIAIKSDVSSDAVKNAFDCLENENLYSENRVKAVEKIVIVAMDDNSPYQENAVKMAKHLFGNPDFAYCYKRTTEFYSLIQNPEVREKADKFLERHGYPHGNGNKRDLCSEYIKTYGENSRFSAFIFS